MGDVTRVKPKAYQPVKKYRQHAESNKKFYNSKDWKALRALKISNNPMCEECEKYDVVRAANYVDHIIPINDGGGLLDYSNLQSLCVYHDSKKRGRESRLSKG